MAVTLLTWPVYGRTSPCASGRAGAARPGRVPRARRVFALVIALRLGLPATHFA